MNRTRVGIAAVVTVAVVVLLVVVAKAMFGGSAYEHGKNYSFQHSFRTSTKTNDGRAIEGRTFVFEDGVTFASPAESTGRQILVLDKALPANTFQIVKKTVAPLVIGKETFDPGGTYDEVRFNYTEPQLPRVTPGNTGR